MHICECSWPIKKRQHKHSDKFSNSKAAAEKKTCRKETFHKSRHAAEHSTHAQPVPAAPLQSLPALPACLAYWPVVKCQRQLQLSSLLLLLLLLGLCFMRTASSLLGTLLVWLKAKPSAGTKPQQRRAKRKMNCRKKKAK